MSIRDRLAQTKAVAVGVVGFVSQHKQKAIHRQRPGGAP